MRHDAAACGAIAHEHTPRPRVFLPATHDRRGSIPMLIPVLWTSGGVVSLGGRHYLIHIMH